MAARKPAGNDTDLVVAPEDVYDRRNPDGPVVLIRRKGETIPRNILAKYGVTVDADAKKVSPGDTETKARRRANRAG